jgi:hypothetical protein
MGCSLPTELSLGVGLGGDADISGEFVGGTPDHPGEQGIGLPNFHSTTD